MLSVNYSPVHSKLQFAFSFPEGIEDVHLTSFCPVLPCAKGRIYQKVCAERLWWRDSPKQNRKGSRGQKYCGGHCLSSFYIGMFVSFFPTSGVGHFHLQECPSCLKKLQVKINIRARLSAIFFLLFFTF